MRDSLLVDDRAPLGETLGVMRREGRRRIRLLAMIFLLVGLFALGVGWNWPKKYFAATTVLVAEDKTIQKLMEGRAYTTSAADRALIAREVIFSRTVMNDVLGMGGWLEDAPDAAERELRGEFIEGRTTVGSPRDNLIRFEYWDHDATRAAQVAQYFADRFIAESRGAQMRESGEAFEFIFDEAARYQQQLAELETGIEAYRAAHPEARSEPATLIESRIGHLRRRIEAEQASMPGGLYDSMRAAGAPAAEMPTGAGASPLQRRMIEVQDELDDALLRYTDAHPEAIRLRRELASLRLRQQRAPLVAPGMPGRTYGGQDSATANAARSSRIAAAEDEIEVELERLRRLSHPAAELAQLIREHDVARDLYQDLLRRLEYARLSKRLDEQGRGLSFEIQEPAVVPMQARGARFAHFAAGGLVAAASLPLALLFLFVRFDPHIRSAAALQRRTGLRVISTMPMHWTAGDQRLYARDRRIALAVVALTLLAFGVAGAIKLALV